MKIAIVHDYFTQMGGAEKVAGELFRLDQSAAVFATVALDRCLPPTLEQVKVNTSWMQRLPMLNKFYRVYFLLYPFGVRALDLSGFDVVLSSSSGYAKGIRVPRHALHICYCHTPMRWVWSYATYSERAGMGQTVRWLISRAMELLRIWDLSASRQPDHFIANSAVVAQRIQKVYGRYADVINPPIEVERFSPSAKQGDYYLILSRLISYKRIDLAVRACVHLGRRLIVVGQGPDLASLRKLAGPTIEFAGRLPDEEVERYAAECLALIFPAEEDFGMAPLEVAAAGRPTIAFRAGGALETVVENETGLFFDEPTHESLADAILRFEQRSWSQTKLRLHAEKFSVKVFQQRMRDFLEKIGVSLALSAEQPPQQDIAPGATTERSPSAVQHGPLVEAIYAAGKTNLRRGD